MARQRRSLEFLGSAAGWLLHLTCGAQCGVRFNQWDSMQPHSPFGRSRSLRGRNLQTQAV